MSNFTNEILKLLKDNNCTFVRPGKGDHSIWHSPIAKYHINYFTTYH